MKAQSTCVAVLDSQNSAFKAFQALRREGLKLSNLSIIAPSKTKNIPSRGRGDVYTRGEYLGAKKVDCEKLWRSLPDSVYLEVPTIGTVAVAGPLIEPIVSALDGFLAVTGLGFVGVGMYSLGVPRDSILEYERELTLGKCVVIAMGDQHLTSLARLAIRVASPKLTRQHIHHLYGLPGETREEYELENGYSTIAAGCL
jgi:hypothetical protein